MTCADYARHERLVECSGHDETVMVAVELADGCSGRLCPDCADRLSVWHWPDLADRIAGPPAGLDTLDRLRALTAATNREIWDRDGGKCVVHGDHATEVHHRIHGNRKDRRPSNLLSVCRKAHDWIEHHFTDAEAKGWTVSRHGQDTTKIKAWYENGPLGQGEYLLGDDLTLNLVEAA